MLNHALIDWCDENDVRYRIVKGKCGTYYVEREYKDVGVFRSIDKEHICDGILVKNFYIENGEYTLKVSSGEVVITRSR